MIRFSILAILIMFWSCPDKAQEKSSFIDARDDTRYETVKIGDQWWMAENLAYIPNVSPPNTDRGIYVYDYRGFDVDSAIKTNEYKTYGCLYTWDLAKSTCPIGWHLSTDEEWKQLEKSLGMSSFDADSVHWRHSGNVDLKIMSESGWKTKVGNNESGFSALPGGIRFIGNDPRQDTIFAMITESGIFWTSTGAENLTAWTRGISYRSSGLGRAPWRIGFGLSVRCVKNQKK